MAEDVRGAAITTAIVGLVGVIVGSVLTALLNFTCRKRRINVDGIEKTSFSANVGRERG